MHPLVLLVGKELFANFFCLHTIAIAWDFLCHERNHRDEECIIFLKKLGLFNTLPLRMVASLYSPEAISNSCALRVRIMSLAGDSEAPPPPPGISIPTGYKAKRCKLCRTFSTARTPMPLGISPGWDPLIPWAAGKKDRPKGLVCRLCLTVLNSDVVQLIQFEKKNSMTKNVMGQWAKSCDPLLAFVLFLHGFF